MVWRTFLFVLASLWLFEVEVEANKLEPCSQPGAINGSRLISQRNDTCGVIVNYTSIEVCEDGGWREICDGTFTQEDAQVTCRQLGFSAIRATAGGLDQLIGSFTTSFSPECNGQELSIFDCHRAPLSSSGMCLETYAKIYVACFVEDPVSGPSCNPMIAGPASTSTAPVSEFTTATSVAPPPHTTPGTGSVDLTNGNTDSPIPNTNVGAPKSGEPGPLSTILIAAIAVPVGIFIIIILILLIIALLVCKRSSHRKQNFNDQVSPDSPVKVRNNQTTERYKDLEPGTYSELNNSTVIQHQVPVYDTVKNKSRDSSEVSASDSNEDVDNHTYSALDPDAIYTQIPPHLGLGPGNSKTLPVGMKDVSPSELYQKLDRSLSLPRSTGASNSASGYMLPHAVNRTALALASGNISETDLASPRSDASIKYPSPHGSPKQHHSSSSQSSTSKEELPLIRNPTNAQMENYYHVLDKGAPTVLPATASSAITTTANSDIDSQVSTDAVCNQQVMDNRRQPHCHHSPRRQRQRGGAAAVGPGLGSGEMMVTAEEGGDQQHFYAVLEPSVRAQLTPPSRHDTRQRSQSQSTTLNNRSPPQRQRMLSSGSSLKGDVRVNYSGQRVVNNFSPTSPNITAATAAEVTNTLV